ncbi:hypothetical protein KI387_030559, partial [Taxus chinensis]
MGVPFPVPWFQSAVDLDITKGANFASAGSGLLDYTSQSLNVLSFGHQVKEFKNIISMLEAGSEHGHYETEQFLWDSIIAIHVGEKDIAGNYMANATLRNTVGPEAFIEFLLKVYENYLLRLHKMGGRKFVVLPLGCSTGMRYSGLARWND